MSTVAKGVHEFHWTSQAELRHTLRHEWTRIAACAGFFALSVFVNSLSEVTNDRNVKESTSLMPIKDTGFMLLPQIGQKNFHRWLTLGMAISVMLPILGCHPLRFRILNRLLLCFSMCYWLRAVSLLATMLPKPSASCESQVTQEEHIVWQAIKVSLALKKVCGDALFSDETVFLSLIGTTFTHYGFLLIQRPVVFFLALACVWTAVFTGLIAMIAARIHYTCDVLVGLIVTTLVWTAYHSRVKRLGNLRIYHLIKWVETDPTPFLAASVSPTENENSRLLGNT